MARLFDEFREIHDFVTYDKIYLTKFKPTGHSAHMRTHTGPET